MRSFYKWYICLAFFLLVFSACRKSDEYKKYMAGGEVIYPAKVDSVKIFPGKNRIMFSWIKTDPRVTKYSIFWNLGSDSLLVNVAPTGDASSPDTIRIIIPDLEETNYEFSIVSYDEDNNHSVKTLVESEVYGENYVGTLLNRVIKCTSVIMGSGFAEIAWFTADSTEIGIELTYTNVQDEQKARYIHKDSIFTKLAGYKAGTSFRYRTLYLPVSTAIDTFYTDYITIDAPPITYPELNKSKFKAYVLPGDVVSAWGWILPYLWDGNISEGRGFHTPEVNLPQHFTFDLGVEASLHDMKVWQRQGAGLVYDAGNFKRFEIWGSSNPASDGSYVGWTKLLDCTSVKPSGAPLGTVTAQDVAYAYAGELFIFPAVSPVVRYIRFKMLENWSGSKSNHIMEVTFRGVF